MLTKRRNNNSFIIHNQQKNFEKKTNNSTVERLIIGIPFVSRVSSNFCFYAFLYQKEFNFSVNLRFYTTFISNHDVIDFFSRAAPVLAKKDKVFEKEFLLLKQIKYRIPSRFSWLRLRSVLKCEFKLQDFWRWHGKFVKLW